MDRRTFVTTATVTLAGAAVALSCNERSKLPKPEKTVEDSTPSAVPGWGWVRNQFELSPDTIHLSALLVASHPRAVRTAIRHHRRRLNADPVTYLEKENSARKQEVRQEAAKYLGSHSRQIALTDSTTTGLALVYNGLSLEPGQELLTTEHDYYVTHESLRLTAQRTGAVVKKVRLYQENPAAISADQIVNSLAKAVTPHTRLLALTWVHSNTGLKIPLKEIGQLVAQINAQRQPSKRILVGVDGVHGFGVEDFLVNDLGCDFFMSGCHKWLFGPRGTGIVWGRPDAWALVQPTIPTFMDSSSWRAWAQGVPPEPPTTAARMSPGGFKPFEHQWAAAEAFRFHQRIGKTRVAERTHRLCTQLKEGLLKMPHVQLHTPLAPDLSAGIVCFSVDGLSPEEVVQQLRSKDIVATTTPYATSYPRLTPSIRNTPEEIDTVLQEIRALA